MSGGAQETMKLGPRIALQLRDEIIAGQLEPGAPLRLMPLADRLGVSTTPVREALTILERQGLLNSQLNRGFRVADITPRDVADIYAVHALVSELLAQRATRRLSEDDIDELELLDRKMHEADAAGEVTAAADFNHAFHRRINLAAGSPLLVRFLSETTPFVVRRQDTNVPGWAQQRMDGHREIIAALRERDGENAGRLVGEHVRRSGELASAYAATTRAEDDDGAASRTRPAPAISSKR